MLLTLKIPGEGDWRSRSLRIYALDMAHQGWPTEFPKTKASRAPPGMEERGDEDSQADPRGEEWEGKQRFPDEEPA